MKYNMLIKILDKIKSNAPNKYKNLYPKKCSDDKLNNVRSRTFIHLFLLVSFGIEDFDIREKYITDGSNDGGVDAYFIDKNTKTIFLIQSKFRANENNFRNKEISVSEILKMDISRILSGKKDNELGVEYNGKIKQLQREVGKVEGIGSYKYKVIFLCNLESYANSKIKRLIENFDFDVFDFNRTYNELVFPLIISKYFDPDSFDIKIDLQGKTISHSEQLIKTRYGDYNIKIIFVPTREIGRIMSKYKNALLVYNPRNYLSLKSQGINKNIKDSIVEKTTGEFAILNNGITIIANESGVQTSTCLESTGTLSLANPQIINGGQTAFTLSEIFNDETSVNKLDGKEVMLKIITPLGKAKNNKNREEFLAEISKSTNFQNVIKPADLRANESISSEIQKYFYENHNLLYERKRGEFEHAKKMGYIDNKNVVDRLKLIKAYYAYSGNPGLAKNATEAKLFSDEMFNDIYNSTINFEELYNSYYIWDIILNLEKKHKGEEIRSNVFKYGKLAVLYAVSKNVELYEDRMLDENNIELLIDKWNNFEDKIKGKSTDFDFANYYKKAEVARDISEFEF